MFKLLSLIFESVMYTLLQKTVAITESLLHDHRSFYRIDLITTASVSAILFLKKMAAVTFSVKVSVLFAKVLKIVNTNSNANPWAELK